MDRILKATLNAFRSIKDNAIGEGEFGIVVNRFIEEDLHGVCVKLSKFQYNINEYPVLEHAYNQGCNVPKPLGEYVDHRFFAMQRINGQTLEELKDLKFSQDVFEMIEDTVRDLCRHITHNDLAPRNVMLEDVVIEDGVVVDATSYVIDFGKSVVKNSADNDTREADSLISWLKRRVAR